MYWPIGAPRIYSDQGAATQEASDDDEESSDEGGNPVAGEPTLDANGNARDEIALISGPPTPATPNTEHGINDLQTPTTPRFPLPAATRPVRAFEVARSGHLFAVITDRALTIWQSKPTVILASTIRSDKSLQTYGHNVALLLRPDSAIFVVQTTRSYLITYTLASDSSARVYKARFDDPAGRQSRRHSHFSAARTQGGDGLLWGAGEGGGAREVSLRFRMVIKIDAGICKAMALDNELIVATRKPAAIQCIKWTPDGSGSQTSTELFSRMDWMPKKASVTEMIYDRPMHLSAWVTDDGRAYAVQRLQQKTQSEPAKLFKGYCFHVPLTLARAASKVAINARYSLLAVGCADRVIRVYIVRDYMGNIDYSHCHDISLKEEVTGALTCLAYSPDGYCLFAGFERGWATWSVFGKPGANNFAVDHDVAEQQNDGWLKGVLNASWLGAGCELLFVTPDDQRIWNLEFARSALTGCYISANISRSLLQTSSGLSVYQGHDLPDLTTIAADSTSWHHTDIPASYLLNQWPIRCSVISLDGRYVAVAGRRGLAHYSLSSGRWKTFNDEDSENEFQVRGGMCWHQHILVAAVELDGKFELRLYSREADLNHANVLHVQSLSAPIVVIASSGQDSLLVYTHENLLRHYIFTAVDDRVGLIQVGQIAFHGIVRSPTRVRAISWILPDEQVSEGDPSQDVAVASVLFLVDGKLVLLQPSMRGPGDVRYDMKVIAQNVEYYLLMREQASPPASWNLDGSSDLGELPLTGEPHSLRNSIWYFDGARMQIWSDTYELLRAASSPDSRELPPTLSIDTDFYPLSIVLQRGLILGLEPEIVQRRVNLFAYCRFGIRTQLFIPRLLRHHLKHCESGAAQRLASQYQNLAYFAHALEILLHDVLDDTVDASSESDDTLLPSVLSFLLGFPQYLDIIVQCTRKTEFRSWRTLFKYLPPPHELFEESLQQGALKTAGGYLLVLHTFENLDTDSELLYRLLSMAKEAEDWELCKELASFLQALDPSGATLIKALSKVDLYDGPQPESNGVAFTGFKSPTFLVPSRPASSNGSTSEVGSKSVGRTSPLERGSSCSPANVKHESDVD